MRRKTLAIVSSAAVGAVLLGLASDAAAASRGGRGFTGGGGRGMAIRGGSFRGAAVGSRGALASIGTRPSGAFGLRRPIAGVRPGWVGSTWAGGWRPGVGWGGGWRRRVGWGWGWGWGGFAAGLAATAAATTAWSYPYSYGYAYDSDYNQCQYWNGFRWVNTCNQFGWSSWW